MIDWKLAYRWTRDALAILGAIGCALVLLVVGLVCAQVYFPRSPVAEQARDELAGADSLLNEAGIVRAQQELALLGNNPGEWLPADNSNVQLWCLRAPGLALNSRWLRPVELQPMFAQAVATTVEAIHRAHSCVPSWAEVQERGMALQPMQFVFSQRDLGFARIALYDRERATLYLLSRSVPTPLPKSAPGSDAAASAALD